MNRKAIFSLLIVVCTAALSACGSASPTATSPGNNPNSTVPASSSDGGITPLVPDTSGGASDQATLACAAGSQSASLTPEVTEGPYFKAGSPERASLLDDGMTGTQIVITGYVYTPDCKPVAQALLDFWQADANGKYDNQGYTLRGHQFTDANGRYQLTTVVPGLYPGRTEHIHVKVQAPDGKMITSQLFFPGVDQNDSDGIFDPALLLNIQTASDGLEGKFNFVVPAG